MIKREEGLLGGDQRFGHGEASPSPSYPPSNPPTFNKNKNEHNSIKIVREITLIIGDEHKHKANC